MRVNNVRMQYGYPESGGKPPVRGQVSPEIIRKRGAAVNGGFIGTVHYLTAVLPAGAQMELSISWPVALNGTVA